MNNRDIFYNVYNPKRIVNLLDNIVVIIFSLRL